MRSRGRRPAGGIDPTILGVRGNGDARGLKQILSGDSESARAVRSGLERRGIDLAGARAVTVFGGDSRAGDECDFTVSRDAVMVVAAPGTPMEAGAQDTATPIRLHIMRARLRPASEAVLPEPLADPLQDIRIHRATAEAYLVRAGEYIQIIDVAGRQCTDFQCFAARKLDKGIERPLDVTTTRSLVGQSYPLPGLFSKAFDQEMQPLVEVVRDTVGRHDAFALACYARYYDDQGYPGHVNCTDNFNKELAPYGIAARKGWMALNFFYNTGIDANNVLYFDEPWSRPGDYVLLRALTDIVCVSSACPDDIDPANGWEPTDIHVRTYSDKQSFSRGVAYRMTPDAEPQLTRETAFHPRFSALTRNYRRISRLLAADPVQQRRAGRRILGLPRAGGHHGSVAAAQVRGDRPGRRGAAAIHAHPQRPQTRRRPGRLHRHVLRARRHDRRRHAVPARRQQFPLDRRRRLWRHLAARAGREARPQGVGALLDRPAAQHRRAGAEEPRHPARGDLDAAGATRVGQSSAGSASPSGASAAIDGAPVVVSRTGYTGELGYEVFCHPKDALTVFDAIWEAGAPHGLMPLGLQALDMLRIEAGLAFAGYEFCDQTDPFEAGIGFTVPLASKNDDFIGREALDAAQSPSAANAGRPGDGRR